MTLKGEITTIIGDFIIDKSLTAEQRAEKILKIVGEIIDEKINTANTNLKYEFGNFENDYQVAQNFDVDDRIEFRSQKSRIETLNELKGEFLK